MTYARRGIFRQDDAPIVIKKDMGRSLTDILWISGLPVVSKRVVSVLSEFGITGWTTYPVTLILEAEGPVVLRSYVGLAILGRSNRVGFFAKHSPVIRKEGPGGVFTLYRGLYVDEESWDGSDLFMSRDETKSFVIATERVRAAFVQSHIRHITFAKTDECEMEAS